MEKPGGIDHIQEVEIEMGSVETKEILVHEPYTDSRGCDHRFVRTTPTEVVCENPGCRLGLFVNPTDRIEDGKLIHVY